MRVLGVFCGFLNNAFGCRQLCMHCVCMGLNTSAPSIGVSIMCNALQIDEYCLCLVQLDVALVCR